jgi:hypothetical protein
VTAITDGHGCDGDRATGHIGPGAMVWTLQSGPAMNPGDVERWAAVVIDRLQRRLRIEDDRVELKAELPADPLRAARRIAGHANQVREDRVLWLIGVTDRPESEPVLGLPSGSVDMGDWWPQVEARFDEVAPSPVSVVVDVHGKAVLALGLETDRRPYVLRLKGDKASREVPWREGTRVRSANRWDLLRLLVPLSRRPILTVLGGRLAAREIQSPSGDRNWRWYGSVSVYVETVERLVLPDHLCAASLAMGDRHLELDAHCSTDRGAVVLAHRPRVGQSEPVGSLASVGDRQLLVDGPTPMAVVMSAETRFDESPVAPGARGRLEMRIGIAGMERPTVRLDAALRPAPSNSEEAAAWSLDEATPG